MVICPHCAYPYTGGSEIIAERDVVCTRCDWTGSSSKLLIVDDDRVMDPRAFDQLYFFLHKEVAPIVGRTLIQLGMASSESTPDNMKFLGEVLRDYTSAGFEVLIKGILKSNG